ncbi:MAG: hypothetical protein AAF579_17335 [Cyanobacteria bacterium P01_C01_bin.118]
MVLFLFQQGTIKGQFSSDAIAPLHSTAADTIHILEIILGNNSHAPS